ncbi:hypothetical protein BdWA1_001944 [Babesia duncani]|uniref:Uncharacterized protein n=1 Tax=Babesia duncani TaxID=323732 RepID=A0AAD9PL47_9APIC|nr:hypothetical protein BdWA1_001944 [Babesia duncani]
MDDEHSSTSGRASPSKPQLHPDMYMSRLDIKDNIRPLWEHEELVVHKTDLKDEPILEYTYSLPKFIERVSIVSEESVTSYESEVLSDFSIYDVEEHEIRGVDLADVQWDSMKSQIPDSHQICINGTAMHGQIVECIDLSFYSEQCPIFHYEWFIGMDFNCPDRYLPHAISTGKTLRIPLEAIGKYIFCRGYRKIQVELQDTDPPIDDMYDPHVAKSLRKKGSESHIIASQCSLGPVDISNEWALHFLDCLENKKFDIDIEIRLEGRSKIPRTFKVNLGLFYDNLKIECKDENEQLELIDGFYNGKKETNELRLEYDDIIIKDHGRNQGELTLYMDDAEFENVDIILKMLDTAQCVLVLYTIRVFIARMDMDMESIPILKHLETLNLDYIKTMVRKVLYDYQ